MKPIFGPGPSLELRLVLAILLSISLIFIDSKLIAFKQVRVYLHSAVSPLQYIANMPGQVMDSMSNQVITREQLKKQNSSLREQLLLNRADQLLMESLAKENTRLRALLGSPVRNDSRKLVAEIMAVDSDPFSHQVVIDKGKLDGVFEGQPVINDIGVIGQVLHVGTTTSRVLLITDASHGIPVRIARNDIRAVATGTGELNRLQLPHIPRSTDIGEGDVLVTSGLGGVFPEGYPVAVVNRFDYQEGKPYADVMATPVVELDRLRYLLLIWP
ncbi:rod shape-determining protein MreC [Agarivorans aestuarii]|uniref:Cell shape-determining protein MreC n=1 Tax=Agarivorans aestuarii TaxID=1563703 RepID=A0ABU7G7Z8_9ALTE|nr:MULTISPECIES: rod shape-determining protein MreC [Agarivorans]MEE1675410.1 rod shape-determining protein MreC [Agarivorans aestuarii]